MPRYLIWISALCLLILAVQDIAAYKPQPTKAQLRYMIGSLEVGAPVGPELRTRPPG